MSDKAFECVCAQPETGETLAGRTIALVWNHFGPYHFARLDALQRRLPSSHVYGVQIADRNTTYAWHQSANRQGGHSKFRTLFPNREAETISAREAFAGFGSFLTASRTEFALLPSYWPAASAALLLAAKAAGVRPIMMNESHAGTEAARGAKRIVKRVLVKLFDAALVGGQPHVRHFGALGIPSERIFPGYDAVDNRYFEEQSQTVRLKATELRRQYRLPERYILSLGRMVEKKNLDVLVQAYAEFVRRWTGKQVPALVFVGSGEGESRLKERCVALGLPWWDCSGGAPAWGGEDVGGRVFFYGFRQIEENPIFYALADLFVLPSTREEWGLVVNEAMACGLPVVVSRVAGCAEDLVLSGSNGYTFDPENTCELADRLIEICQNGSLAAKMSDESRSIIGRWGCENFANNAVRAIESAQLATKGR